MSHLLSMSGTDGIEESLTVDSSIRKRPVLTLGIAPVIFTGDRMRIGRLDPVQKTTMADLRREHGRTYAFRFDSRDRRVSNIGLRPGIEPLGEIEDVPIEHHLLLIAEAIEQQLRRWLSRSRKILRRSRPLVCLGHRDRLLTRALRDNSVAVPDERVDVLAKWSFELRPLSPAVPDHRPSLGLIVDVATSNVIDIPVSELVSMGFDPTGCYVGTSGEVDDLIGFSRLRLVGRVRRVDKTTLVLDDQRDEAASSRVPAADVFVEARRETLDALARTLFPTKANAALSDLRRIRTQYINGRGKLERIRHTIAEMNRSARSANERSLNLRFTDGISVTFGPLLDQSYSKFPRLIETKAPTLLFGASGHNQHTRSDAGIRMHGPFQYAHNPINDPTIIVLSEKAARGRMEQFVNDLRDGVAADNGRFSGGLIGKFRLTGARFYFVDVVGDTSEEYTSAIQRALDELPDTPALALVQVRESHKQRPSGQDPYFVAKCRLMRAGVPVQAVRLETIEEDYGRGHKLNNLALGAYAKIGGTPWVISTRGVASHEIVFGIGCTEVSGSRLGVRTRYVGITALFQGDGRYLLWETTREAKIDDYPEAILETLRKSIRFVKTQNRWSRGDNVRLVFHAYKPLKRIEIGAVKQLVEEMLNEYPVEFAFLDVSHHHPFQIFDPRQTGVKYWAYEKQRHSSKGVFVPDRGTAILLGPRTALLQLVGANDVKTWAQGIPRPLLLELHRDSDFADLTYLVRQAFHFSFMSWRSFFPSHEPVTVLYSRWIATLLGKLKSVPEWDSVALNHMRDRRAMWFL